MVRKPANDVGMDGPNLRQGSRSRGALGNDTAVVGCCDKSSTGGDKNGGSETRPRQVNDHFGPVRVLGEALHPA